MKLLITNASLNYLVESFVNVFSLDVDPAAGERTNVAKIIDQSALVAAVIVFIQPFPVADILVLAPLLAKMTLHIGKAKGFEVSQERALEIVREVIGAIGLAWAAGAVAASLLKMVPLVGGLLLVPFVYGATYAVGKIMDLYFDGMRRGTVPRADEIQELFGEFFSEGKARGAALGREDLEAAARDLRRRIAEREAAAAARARGEEPGVTVKVRERAVKKPRPEAERVAEAVAAEPGPPAEPVRAGKTIGPVGSVAEEASVPASSPPSAKKTIGPTEPPPPAPTPEPVAVEPARSPASGPALVSELERLAKLRELGALTPEEFDLAKKRLLGG